MIINTNAVILLLMAILLILIGFTYADTSKDPVILNVSEFVNSSADTSDTLHNAHNRDNAVAGTIRWYDKTTVSGKIKNFVKDFQFQSGITL
jgi:hypothetical protein